MLKTYRNIPVLPIQEVLGTPQGRSEHKLGPIYPDWTGANKVRFHRNGRPHDTRPDLKVNENLTYLKGTYAWGGPIVDHFGHQIADFSTRLAMYKGMNCHYLFSVGKLNGFNIKNLPKFVVQILEWFHVPLDKIIFVDKPVLVDKLIVAPQQEQLSQIAPNNKYLNILGELSKVNGLNHSGSAPLVYVTRSGQSKGILAGEKYLESIFRDEGYKIVRPENLPLKEQLDIYINAEQLIFSEGSAMYGIQLLGKLNCDVHVLQRRPNRTIGKAGIGSRTKSLNYHPIGKLVAGLNKKGRPLADAGITIITILEVKKLLNFLNIDSSKVDEVSLHEAIMLDVKKFMDDEKLHHRASVEGHISTIEKQLEKLGLI
ncbi:glycosyltransferase 61 family protein [Paraglaciecola sp. 2405UD69-4]|uniref:glycosyltransferase 61 family protein n=1 Tax=Paraglaciecola sp. 2405UD69-4 TaxID=3391836 RepID=UPI0039C9AC23